jgi:hypothetical protein
MLNFVRTEDATVQRVNNENAVDRLDRVGMTASFLCAVHCAIMPLVVTLLPLLGLTFLASEPIEWALLASSATLGTLSLCMGFKEHRSRRVFAVLGVALALLVLGRIAHSHDGSSWSLVFMVAGGLTMMGAHIFNHYLCRSCRRCSSHECH